MLSSRRPFRNRVRCCGQIVDLLAFRSMVFPSQLAIGLENCHRDIDCFLKRIDGPHPWLDANLDLEACGDRIEDKFAASTALTRTTIQA